MSGTRTPRLGMVLKGGPTLASARMQGHAWLPYLEREQIECRVIVRTDDVQLRALYGTRTRTERMLVRFRNRRAWQRRLRDLLDVIDWADVLYVQEVLLPRAIVERLVRSGKRLIFSFSDPIHLTNSPGHGVHSRIEWILRLRRRFECILDRADAVIIENARLTEIASSGGAEVLVFRGPVDTNAFRPVGRGARTDPIIIGWTGSPSTYRYFEPLFPLFQEYAREFALELRLIGAPEGEIPDGLRVTRIPWSVEAERVEVPRFDIGVSYQPDTEFERFRGGFKILLYMACGVAAVVSPGGIGDQVIRSGESGFLARDRAEWSDALRALLTDSSLRDRLAKTARAEAVKKYSYDAYWPDLRRVIRAG